MSLLFEGSEWTFPLIEKVLAEVEEIGRTELNLKLRPNQVEVITADQMIEAYTSHGMPIMYPHWSTGKAYLQQQHAYKGGQMGLAYEIVINSDPVIALLMEGNSMPMQTLVLAHASVGHGAFFEMNYLFKDWTDPEAVIDYLIFAKKYVRLCEERYGIDAVESILDAAHSLRHVSFDRYKRPPKLSEEARREKDLFLKEAKEGERTEFFELIAPLKIEEKVNGDLQEPEENILYFLEKHAPNLETWQRELLRIVRKIQQYFYPQMLTKLMNEGFATSVHYYILNRLYELGKITEGALLECMHVHSQVVGQAKFSSNMNPYALGFAMFKDIKRICEVPTEEDREWFPDLVGTDFKEAWLFAVKNFKDESFILQYLSPKLMREWRMFMIHDDADDFALHVRDIHNEEGYKEIRRKLSNQYKMENSIPVIEVRNADMKGDRTLYLYHPTKDGVLLEEKEGKKVVEHIRHLWGYPVVLRTVGNSEEVLQEIIVL